MAPRRALLLVNAQARQGSQELSRAIDLLRNGGLDLVDAPVGNPGHIPDVIHRHRGSIDLIILGGGDGTMNRSVEAVLQAGVPLGILPLGTANDLARTLGIPPGLDEACAVIAAGHTHRIDLGRVNGKHFFNVASMGMSVEIARCLTGEVKKRWGMLGYCVTALDRYRAMRSFSAEIVADGRFRRLRSIQLSVGNGRFYGGGMTVAEDAAIDDGQLDLYSLKPPGSLLRLLALLPAFRAGRHAGIEEVHTARARRIEVRTRRTMPINTDGELTTETPAVFEIVPKALSVFVPETRQAPGLLWLGNPDAGKESGPLREARDAAA